MQTSSLPTVGLDRFIAQAWLDKALDIAASNGSPDELRTWLSRNIAGEAALKKTNSVLSSLWLRSIPETKELRHQALTLAPDLSTDQRIILHWGMALATYPLFRITASTMGRMLRLQGEFQIADIRSRVLEHHGNIGTVPRAVSRIVQSVKDWGLIAYDGDHYVATRLQHVKDRDLLAWLFEACVSTSRRDHWDLADLLQAVELFPFDQGSAGHLALRSSSRFIILREGLDREIVLLAEHSAR